MPGVWEIAFLGVEPKRVFHSGIHALLGNWFREKDHHAAKGYSILRIHDAGAAVVATIGLLDSKLEELLSLMPAGFRHRFGSSTDHIGLVAAPPNQIQHATWDELLGVASAREWLLQFETPICFRRNSMPSPWPDPARIIQALANRWRLGAGEDPPFEVPDPRHVLVSAVDLETIEMPGTAQTRRRGPSRHHGPPVVGALGEVEWRWMPDKRYADPKSGGRELNSLLALCDYTGVGSYPQFGMGSIGVSVLDAGQRR